MSATAKAKINQRMHIVMTTRRANSKWGNLPQPANEPALVCREALIEQPYHYWRGASGARYLHSVYSLLDCPSLPKATYIIVRREDDGTCRPLHIGQTVEDTQSLNLALLRRLGARLGANEVHIHLLAETAEERMAIETDLSVRQMGRSRRTRSFSAANDSSALAVD